MDLQEIRRKTVKCSEMLLV